MPSPHSDGLALRAAVRALVQCTRGTAHIQYVLIASLVSIAIVGAVRSLGLTVEDLYAYVASDVADVAPTGATDDRESGTQ